jgi:hypothetical protein
MKIVTGKDTHPILINAQDAEFIIAIAATYDIYDGDNHCDPAIEEEIKCLISKLQKQLGQ